MPLLLLALGACQTYSGALQVICDAPNDCADCASADPASRELALAKHIDGRLRNGSGRRMFDALASADAETKVKILRLEAAGRGIAQCALADLIEASMQPEPEPEPEPEVEPEPVAPGTDEDRIRDAMRATSRAVRHCYEKSLVKDPSLAGRLVVSFAVADGAVTEATIAESTLEAPAVGECVLEVVRAVRFDGVEATTVRWPYVFSASK